MPMFEGGKVVFLGGNFNTVKDGGRLTFGGNGGGVDYHFDGSAKGNVAINSANDNSSTTNEAGSPQHGGANPGPTAAFAGQPGSKTYRGTGYSAASVTIHGNVEDADVRDSGNDFLQTIGAVPHGGEYKGGARMREQGDGDKHDQDDEEDQWHHAGHTTSNGFNQDNGLNNVYTTFQSHSFSASYSSSDIITSALRNAEKAKREAEQFKEAMETLHDFLQDPNNHGSILAATGGPTFTDVEAGAHVHKVNNSRTTIIVNRGNINNCHYDNVGNDNSTTR